MSPDVLCLVGLQQEGYNLCHLISYFVNIDCLNPKDCLLALEPRSCVKVEVAVLGALSLMVRTVSVDVKQQ